MMSNYSASLSASRFVALPSPYLDFAVVVRPGRDSEGALDLAASRLRGAGFWCELVDADHSSVLLVATDGERVGRDGPRRFGVSGLFMAKGALHAPWGRVAASDYSAIEPECGQFTSFGLGADRLDVETDTFGYGTSFISKHPGFTIASNRLHLHVMVMRSMGAAVCPDRVAVTALLFSDHGLFAQQGALSRTLVEGVDQVPVHMNLRVEVSSGEARLVPKRPLLDMASLDASAYHSLVDAGVERVVANMRAALDADIFPRLLLEMSAGKDTRLVLAAAMQTPGWGDRVRLKTRGASSDQDVILASGIASLFGLNFFDGSDVAQYPLTIDDNIDFWRSYYFGEYHRFGATGWSVLGENRSDLAVGGANGEIYRKFWSGVMQRDVTPSGSVQDFANGLVRRVAVPGASSSSDLDGLVEAFADDLRLGWGSTLEEHLEDHYLRHRNRSHCGLRGVTVRNEQLIWYPLQSPELFGAARCRPFEVRARNQVVFDALVRLNPLLVDIPFDAGEPFGSVDRSGLESRWERRLALRLDGSTAKWEAAEEAAARKLPGRRADRRAAMAWSRVPSRVAETFDESLEIVRESGSVAEEVLVNVKERFDGLMSRDVRTAYQLASRVFAVADVIR